MGYGHDRCQYVHALMMGDKIPNTGRTITSKVSSEQNSLFYRYVSISSVSDLEREIFWNAGFKMVFSGCLQARLPSRRAHSIHQAEDYKCGRFRVMFMALRLEGALSSYNVSRPRRPRSKESEIHSSCFSHCGNYTKSQSRLRLASKA
jgi:hypothetical protein